MPVSVKIGGVWKTATAVYTKIGGVWKTASDMPLKIAGVWKTGILGPQPGYYAIIHSVLASDTSITFSSIPQGYTDLKIVASLRNAAYPGSMQGGGTLRFNGDSGANYSYFKRFGAGSNVNSDQSNSQTQISTTNSYTAASNYNSPQIYEIFSYSNTTKQKTITSSQGALGDTVTSYTSIYNWSSTSAINSITFADPTGLWGTITVYGIKAAL